MIGTLVKFNETYYLLIQDTEAMKKMQESMTGYQDMYLSGSREIYQVW